MRSISRVLVVTKTSSYDNYVRRANLVRVRKLLKAGDPSVARLIAADIDHQATLVELRDAVKQLGLTARFRDRSAVGDTSEFDLIVTVGGDGTLLSASHSVGATPVFGINSAPDDSVGFLCSARRGNVLARMRALLAGKLALTRLSRMRVTVDRKVVHQRVLNDVLFAHTNPAMTARYFLVFRGAREEQKSSGLWIGPAAGSTAAIHSAGGKVMAPTSRRLQFVVREPYQPNSHRFRWTHGFVAPTESFELWNKMRQAALYLDGPRAVVPLDIGHRVRFDASPEPLHVFGFRST